MKTLNLNKPIVTAAGNPVTIALVARDGTLYGYTGGDDELMQWNKVGTALTSGAPSIKNKTQKRKIWVGVFLGDSGTPIAQTYFDEKVWQLETDADNHLGSTFMTVEY